MTVKYILPLTAAVSSLSFAGQNETRQPNIIYILADDLGYGDLGCYGQNIIKTPNIDKLAKEGMLFTQHYAGSTVSAPSRSVLMTGLHTGHTYIRGNLENTKGDEGQHPLPKNTLTIAKMLKQAGYVTGAFGKWGLGYPGSEGDPNNQGFDEFYGYNCQRIAHNYYPFHLWQNQTKIMLQGNEGTKKEQYAQDIIHRKALRFIQDNASHPFFAFLPYVLPHAELVNPQDSILNIYKEHIEPGKPYVGIDRPGRPSFKNGAYCSSQEPHADFAAMVSRLDAYVGEIIDELKRQGLEKNTIVMFSSDNGPHSEGGADPEFFNSSGPFRGIKRDLYEGGIRVPFIVWGPGKVKAESKNDQPSAFWDILPTIADVCQIKSPGITDGISLYPSLYGKSGQKKHKYLYWEFHEQGGKIAVRYGKWKGIILNYTKNPNENMELYDLSKDIHEDTNVAGQHPAIVKKIHELIKSSRTSSDLFNFGLTTYME